MKIHKMWWDRSYMISMPYAEIIVGGTDVASMEDALEFMEHHISFDVTQIHTEFSSFI